MLAPASSLLVSNDVFDKCASVTCFVKKKFYRRITSAQNFNKTKTLAVKTTRAVVVFILELILHRRRLFAGKQGTTKKTPKRVLFLLAPAA